MSIGHLVALLVIGTLCAMVAERVLRTPIPYGWLGAAAAGFLGAWLAVDVVHLSLVDQIALQPVPIVPALIGAVVVVLAFRLLSGRRLIGRRR